MVTLDHTHTWKLETLPDGAVRRSCECGARIVDQALGKIAPIKQGYYLGRGSGNRRGPKTRKKKLVEVVDDSKIELKSLLKERGLNGTVEVLRQKRTSLQNQISITNRYLRNSEAIDYRKVNEYVEMNKQLRQLKIFETELTYIKNLL